MWQPQEGPQTAAILTALFIDELLFGGARGGGKSDFLLGDFGQGVSVGFGDAWKGILFRKSYPELEELIFRSKQIFSDWFPGCKWGEQAKTWSFPGGETLKMRYMEREADAENYQGHQYTWIGFDELGNWKNLDGYKKLKATLRSAEDGMKLRMRASANPGGPGHHEVKTYFGIDSAPLGNKVIADPDTHMARMFIRSRVEDNKILLRNDPNYVNRLKGTGSPELVRAWLDGDWDVTLGAFFDNWRHDRHVVERFTIPDTWPRFMSGDWGSAKPFSFGWWAIVEDDYLTANGLLLPRGCLVRYREWYGAKKDPQGVTMPDKGLKMNAEDVGRGLAERNGAGLCHLDPAAFAEDGGPSIEERLSIGCKRSVIFVPADNKRVARKGALGGWDQMRARLDGDADGNPMLVFFDNCADSIRTIPALQHDELRAEDVDTDSEDHAGDDVRYGCMSRPWVRTKEKTTPSTRDDYRTREITQDHSVRTL